MVTDSQIVEYENIVGNFTSPTLVLAGPGAGKTYLLADRIKRLLESGTDKVTITALAFGREAQQSMKDKLADPKGDFKIPYQEQPHISTMHSLGFEIIMEKPRVVELFKTDLKVQENEDVKRLMYRDASLLIGCTEEDGKEALKCKGHGNCRKNEKDKKCKICEKYWEIMSKCNYVDFDDQILFACEILEKNPDILEKYQARARYLLIDEYQDINAAQFRLIELLSRTNRNGIFAVGDDAQSIYAFRGSDPQFILDFGKKYFPGGKVFPLAHSRRCYEKIMTDAIKVLKKYYTKWTGEQKLKYYTEVGKEPAIWILPNENSEAEMIAKLANHFLRERKTVLVLVPKNDFCPLIVKKFSKYEIGHDYSLGLLPKRLKVAKLFIEWVKIPEDSFKTRQVIEEIINNGIAKIEGASKNKICKPETIKKRIEEETKIAGLWENVDRKTSLFHVIHDLKAPGETLSKIQTALFSLVGSYVDTSNKNHGEFAKQLSVISGIWNDSSKLAEDILNVAKLLETSYSIRSGLVSLKTMRKAKGLEADIVIIAGLEDDIIPNPRNDLAEEARLFYVSMTRAKQELFLFHCYKRPRNISFGPDLIKKNRSRFLDTIGRKSDWKS